MADEVASLKVLITGDAENLERTIKEVETELAQLEKVSTKGSAKDTAATATNTQEKVKNTEAVKENAEAAAQESASKKESAQATQRETAATEKNTSAKKKSKKELQESAKAWQKNGKAMKDLGDNIDTVTKPLQTTAVVLAAGGVAAAKFAIDFEDSFAAVEKTVEGTPEQLEKVKQGIIDLTTKGIGGRSAIPATTAELNELAAAGGQLGIQKENILEFTETVAQLETATNLSGADGARVLARFMNVAEVEQDKIRNLGSAIVDLGNNSATTEAEIADMAMSMGATGAQVNISAQDILGYATALSSMGIEAEAGGSAVSRIWMAIQQAISAGGAELKMFADLAGQSSGEFAAQWGKDASGAFQKFLQGLNKAEDSIGILSDLGFNNIRDIRALQSLAGEKGFGVLTEAIERSNSAWSENIALQREFDTKASKTAGQMTIAKNNMVEAARSIGETFLPSVVDASNGIKDFAQGLANMSDGQKQALITTGKWIIGLGATSKVTASTVKGVGNVVEAVGKIKSVAAKGDILAKIVKAAPLAAAGIVAVGVAVTAGKKAYDAWYDSQYRFAEDLEEGNRVIEENINKINDLKEAQKKIDEVKLIIENPESSKEEVENAKAQIQTIADMLEERYGLHIDVDAPDLPETVEQVETLVRYETSKAWNQARQDVNTQVEGLGNDREHIEKESPEIERLRAESKAAKDELDRLEKIETKISDLDFDLKHGKITADEYWESMQAVGKELGMAEVDETVNSAPAELAHSMKELNDVIENNDGKVSDFDANCRKLEDSAKITADQIVSLIASAKDAGEADEIPILFERLNETLEKGELEAGDYAKSITDALSGIDLSTAVENGGDDLVQWLDSYTDTAQKLGMSNEEMLLSIAQLANGFADVESASQNMPTVLATLQQFATLSGLSLTAEQLTQTARAIGLIPDDKQITINADGTYAISEVENTISEAESNPVELEVTANTDQAERIIQGLNGTTVFVNVKSNPLALAGGTQNFSGGLAMINDQRGVSDPRELVEVNGKGYLFDGRDVVLPLPEHAKVFTATQTKQMMAGMGIPRYASGKNNDPWENDKADWTHYTRSSLVTISASEYLDWIEKMRQKYADNVEAMKELDEMWVDATKDSWNEWTDNLEYALDMGKISEKEYYDELQGYLDEYVTEGTKKYKDMMLELRKGAIDALEDANAASDAWLGTRFELNDWAEIGDSAEAAFGRIRDRNIKAAEEGLIAWEEYFKTMDKSFEDFVNGRDEYSASWIQTQIDYYGMSSEEEYAAHKRRMDNLNEFVASCEKLTDAQWATYVEVKAEIEQASWDAAARKVEQWRDDASFYMQQSEVFGWDWLNPDDSALQYWERVLEQENKYAKDLELSVNGRQVAARKADEARLEIYKAKTAELDEAMQKYQDEIDAMREQLDDKVQELRDSWTVEDRQKDMAELEKQLEIYKGAVTEEGRNQYESLLDEYTQLQREEQIYKLETENDAIIGKMEEEYARMEAESKEILDALCDDLTAGYTAQAQEISAVNSLVEEATNVANKIAEDTKGYVESLQTEQLPNLQAALDSIAGLVAQIQAAQKEPDINYSQTNYFTVADNVDTSAAASKILRQFQSKYGGR